MSGIFTKNVISFGRHSFSPKKLFLTFIFAGTFFHFLSAQNFNLQFRSEIGYSYKCASVWGYVQNDSEYALVGTREGVSIVDVTDPDNPAMLFNVAHTPSDWREIKTYTHYAYASNENGGGLLIIDLQYLPDTVIKYSFIYTSGIWNTAHAHTLWIDENGRLYLFGGSYKTGGAVIFDLTTDPLNPTYLGEYEDEYIHDGFVRGDTLWASEISSQPGQEEIINVSDPANPVPLVSWVTPNAFTHNAWPTHDDHYLFTTDEVSNSFLTSYDVSDFGNITELDREQSNPGSNVIIHNVHLYNDSFAVVAYYRDGVVLFDVSHPDNMIICGSYDTDPNESGSGFSGTWGVYPYLPSGNIIASDLSDAGAPGGKLSVLTPSYVSACWLQGNITDSVTTAPLNNVLVEILATDNTDLSDLSGIYKTGNGIAGTYTVRFSKLGYLTKEIQNVMLTNGVETSVDVALVPLATSTVTGQVVDSVTNAPIGGATVFFTSTVGYQYTVTTDANGNFSFNGYQSTYDVYAGKWSYHEKGLIGVAVSPNPPPFLFQLSKGYYDDFIFNFGWISSGGSSFTGKWVRGEPLGTDDGYDVYNSDLDVSGDYGDQCYVTGNLGGLTSTSDVDDDVVMLISPVFDLTGYINPYINFFAWWVDGGPFGAPDDTLRFTLSNGSTTVSLLNLKSNASNSSWIFHSLKISDFITSTSNMTMKLSTVDYQGNANWIEGGLDKFEIVDSVSTSISSSPENGNSISVYPNPFIDETTVSYRFDQLSEDARFDVYGVTGKKLESFPVNTAAGTVSFGKNLDAGIYFIHIVGGEKMLGLMKVVKVKQ